MMPRRRKRRTKKKKQNKDDLKTYEYLNEQFWDFIFSGIERALGKKKEEKNVEPKKEEKEEKRNIPRIGRYD